jgi:hypothetical protein
MNSTPRPGRLTTWREMNLRALLQEEETLADRRFMDRLLELRIKKLEEQIARTN